MARTADELIRSVQSRTRDAGGRFITQESILAWLNEAYIDLAARLSLFDEEVTATTDGGNTLAFPTDEELVEITDLTLGDDDHCTQVDSRTWQGWRDSAETPDNTIFRIFERQIELYPTPDTGTAVTLRYKRLPETLDENDDVHVLPSQLERKLVEYAVAQAKMQDGDSDGALFYMGLYEDGLPNPSVGREQFHVKPLRFTHELNLFDVEGSHI